MENSKVRLAHGASSCHVSRPGAVGFVLDRGLIPPFLLPPQNLKGGGMFMMDRGLFFFFLKGSITGCRMGGIRIETSVM